MSARRICNECGDDVRPDNGCGCPLDGGETTVEPSRTYRLKPEHANSVLLCACASAGFTEEQTIDALTKHADELERRATRQAQRAEWTAEHTDLLMRAARGHALSSPEAGRLIALDKELRGTKTDACPERGDDRPGQGSAR